jgi:hypothetical protein
MLAPRGHLLLLLAAFALPAASQDAESGVTVPVSVTGGAIYSHRMQGDEPTTSPYAGAFHASFSPSLKLNAHWFVYSSLQLWSTPFYYYDAYAADREIKFHAVQAFLGYTQRYQSVTLIVKAGQLASAFGSFPLHYDDADNALLDQPLPYATYLKFRPDQLACGTQDLIQGGANTSIDYHCGGSQAESYGITPVSVYGLPGMEIDLATNKLDARLQVTNSSPANPQTLLSGSQHLQWTAGGGYTVLQGFRVGGSAFEGPYLDHEVAALLPAGKTVGDFPATGLGLDAQWARGRWKASGECQWFHFDYPNFRVSPSSLFAYAEIKAVITPRIYAALRVGDQRNSRVADMSQQSSQAFEPNEQAYEFAIGYRPNRWQLVKVGYEWLRTSEVSGTRDNVLGVQFVTSLPTISKAWR